MIAEVINVNKILEQALLFDFYGELLTEHQKEIYEQFVLEDLSLSEIAQGEGISRQGVHDLVRRCQKILEGYEDKLHLVDKFLSVKEKVREINEALDSYEKQGTDIGRIVEEIRRISDTIIEEL
ncbi:YlxM family DNA-binding protein [Faecalicatena contorta]